MGATQSSNNLGQDIIDAFKLATCVNGPSDVTVMTSNDLNASIMMFGETHHTASNPLCTNFETILRALLPDCRRRHRPNTLPIHCFVEANISSSPQSIASGTVRHNIADVTNYATLANLEKIRCKDIETVFFYNADVFGRVRGMCLLQEHNFYKTCYKCMARIVTVGRGNYTRYLNTAGNQTEYIQLIRRQFLQTIKDWPIQYTQFVNRQSQTLMTSYFAVNTLDNAYLTVFKLMSMFGDCYLVKAMMQKCNRSQLIISYNGRKHVRNMTTLLSTLNYTVAEKMDLPNARVI